MAVGNMLCNMPDYLALALSQTGALHAEPLPFVTPTLELSMSWLSVMDSDPAERWLRRKVEHVMGTRKGSP